MVGDQNVFWLEIPMVDSNGVTILNSVQDLEENVFGKSIITDKVSLFSDVGEQVAFRAVFEHNESAVRAIQNAHQGDHVGMLASLVMQSDFAALETLLSVIQSMFGESLHGVQFVSEDVNRLVNDAVRSNTKDRDQFESVCQDTSEPIFWC